MSSFANRSNCRWENDHSKVTQMGTFKKFGNSNVSCHIRMIETVVNLTGLVLLALLRYRSLWEGHFLLITPLPLREGGLHRGLGLVRVVVPSLPVLRSRSLCPVLLSSKVISCVLLCTTSEGAVPRVLLLLPSSQERVVGRRGRGGEARGSAGPGPYFTLKEELVCCCLCL